jgi:23S rRNA (pseudouridine1915-N3)-methyltransferase
LFAVRISIYFIGKPRDAHANAIAAEYVKRTRRYAHCEMHEVKPTPPHPWERQPTARKILLDPAGRTLDSAGFTEMVDQAEQTATGLVFLIGGAEGPPEWWRQQPGISLLSLSPMTYPHELARAMLTEQIYRAFTTLRGHPYPK